MDDLSERPFLPIATPLYYAVSCGFTELARGFIVDRGDDVNAGCGRYGTPLHAASYKGDLTTASLLLQYGADVNSSIGGQVPLRRAYNGGHVGVMCLLLDYGADGDMRDGNRLGTVLHHASYDGQLEMVRLLLQAGADVNGKGFADQTPLHLAVIKGQTKVAQLLIQHGADANAKSEISFTPFQAATMYARHDIVQLMLEGGAEREEGL
ncbi:ankyrin repeat-containing domain protein [Russula brevipes]|nr:ankyrin repeat-containing domain protein [Russula brevipes]